METGRLDPILIQGIIQAVYRLFRVGTFHAMENDAIDLAITATLNALRQLDAFESEGITLIFADDTCIVNGQLLQAPPDVYRSAMDFSEFLSQVHVNSITIGKGVAESDLRALLGLFVDADTAATRLEDGGFLTPHIRLRLVNPNLLLGLEDDRLSLLERVLLTYALAVLVIRRLFQSIEHGGFDLAGYFKRMARQLATVNYADRPVVLDVILAKHLEPDNAKLAVNSAILAVAMTRRFTTHESTLSRVCMSALLLDVGRHRPASKDDENADLSISTALIHMAMGDLRGDSVERTIVTFEAQRMLLGVSATEIYPDGVEPTIDAHIIATARRFTELLSRGHGGTQLAADGAVEVLRRKASSDVAHMTLDLLIDAIGLIPRGAAVELNSGYRGVVLRAGPSPSKYDQPTVRLVINNRGERVEPASIRLDSDQATAKMHSPVMRVLTSPGALVRSAQLDVAGPFFEWVSHRKQAERNVREWLAEQGKFAESALTLRRAGRSTSSNVIVAGDARKAAMDWDAAAAEQAGKTEVLKRSEAATEFEYRRSAAFETVPDDFAHETPISSVRHPKIRRSSETAARRTIGTGVHRIAQTGGHDVPEFVTRGEWIDTASRRTTGSGVHRTAQTGSHDVSGFVAEPSVRRSKGSGIYRRVETGTDELTEDFTRSSSVQEDGASEPDSATCSPETSGTEPSAGGAMSNSDVKSGAFDTRPSSDTFGRSGTSHPKATLAPRENTGSGGFNAASSSGTHRVLGGEFGAPSPDAFDGTSSSGILRRPSSGLHDVAHGEFDTRSKSKVFERAGSGPGRAEFESRRSSGIFQRNTTGEFPVARAEFDSPSQSGVVRRPSTGSNRTVPATRGESESDASGRGSHSTAVPRPSSSGSPRSIKEHLAARKRTFTGPPAPADILEEKLAPFAGVLRKRTTSAPAIVPNSTVPKGSPASVPMPAPSAPAVSTNDPPAVPSLIAGRRANLAPSDGIGGASILRGTGSRTAARPSKNPVALSEEVRPSRANNFVTPVVPMGAIERRERETDESE
ncbi:MAG: hypothetical protein ACJAYU_000960 [Bradymonadia bacterium]|jgi:hypothetical protein